MGVAIKITGGNPVYHTVERYFSRTDEARSYLREWGVDENDASNKRAFSHKGFSFIISHSLCDIFKSTEDLPDNDMASTYRENLQKFRSPMPTGATRGANGFSRPDGTTPQDKPSNASRKNAASDGTTINLKQLCQELKMDPSKARQKLRKKFGATGQRYEWTPAEVEDIKKVLMA